MKAPKGAPNVVVVLLDNFGFGDGSTFGGPIQMPTLKRIAKTGLRYNNFKVPPLCSPSRMALLQAAIAIARTWRDQGNCHRFSRVHRDASSQRHVLPEILRLNGYSTAMFGKCHELGPWNPALSDRLTAGPCIAGLSGSTASCPVRLTSFIRSYTTT